MVRNFFSSPASERRMSRKERLEQAKRAADAETSRRRNFGFLKTGEKRMNNSHMTRTREHAKKLAMVYNDPADTPSSAYADQQLLGFQDHDNGDGSFFDPFGNNNTSLGPQMTPSMGIAPSTKPKRQSLDGFTLDQHFGSQADREHATASTEESFETESVGSAYDMEFLGGHNPRTIVSPPTNRSKAASLSAFVESNQESPYRTDTRSNSRHVERSVITMPTFPSSNASMQASFSRQNSFGSGGGSAGSSSATGAAARRRMRNQMRHASSNSSVCSATSDTVSLTSTPPESPASSRNSQNRPAYQTGSSFYSQTSSTNNSTVGSEGTPNLFDAENDGGFTFDAFGLDQSEVEREVNEAMRDLAGQGMPGFSIFLDPADEFLPQGWDSSPGSSRRSSPVPDEQEGFVDGFRVAQGEKQSYSNTVSTINNSMSSPVSERSVNSYTSPVARRLQRSQMKGTASTPPRWASQAKSNYQPNQSTQSHHDTFEEVTHQNERGLAATPPRWESQERSANLPNLSQVNHSTFEEEVNPWKEDPWGSDQEEARSDYAGVARSEINTPTSKLKDRFHTRFSDSKSDVGGSSLPQNKRSVTFHRDIVQQTFNIPDPEPTFEDEDSDEINMQEDMAHEFTSEFQEQQYSDQYGAHDGSHLEHDGFPQEYSGQYGAHDGSHLGEDRRLSNPSFVQQQAGMFHSSGQNEISGDDTQQVAPEEYDSPRRNETGQSQSFSNRFDYGRTAPATSSFVPSASHEVKTGVGSFRARYEQSSRNRAAQSVPEHQFTPGDSDEHGSRAIDHGQGGAPTMHLTGVEKDKDSSYDVSKSRFGTPVRSAASTSRWQRPTMENLREVPTIAMRESEVAATSESGAYSDFAGNSDIAVASDIGLGSEVLNSGSPADFPAEVSPSKRAESKSNFAPAKKEIEEKKDDHSNSSGVQNFGSLRSKLHKWQPKEEARTSAPSPSWRNNTVSEKDANVDDAIPSSTTVPSWRKQSVSHSTDARANVPGIADVMSDSGGHPNTYNTTIRPRSLRPESMTHSPTSERAPTSPESTQLVADQATPFAGLRDRLKPTPYRVANKAKSEAGGYVSPSSAERSRRESPPHAGAEESVSSLRETRSDAGQTSSPSYLSAVNLKKTAVMSPQNESPSNRQAAVDEVHTQEHCEAEVAEKEPSPVRKLTYRERRELELQKEQEVKSRLVTTKQPEPKKDVASLIRRRIAANKQKNVSSPRQDESSRSSQMPNFRDKLRPVVLTPTSPSSTSIERHSPRENGCDKSEEDPHHPGQSSHFRQHAPEPFELAQQDSNAAAALIDVLSPSTVGSDMQYSTGSSPRHRSPRNHNLMGLRQIQHDDSLPPKNEPTPTSFAERHVTPSQFNAEARQAETSVGSDAVVAAKHSRVSPVSVTVSKADHGKQSVVSVVENNNESDVKSMLTNFLGARANPLASIPKPVKDDTEALKRSKKHLEESSLSPRANKPEIQPPPPPPQPTSTGNRMALKDDPNYERYFRMLKVGMPMDVVKHAMQKDGKDPSVMDDDHEKPVGLPLKEDPKYTKYFKMIKIGVSMDQVKHAMACDGLMPDVMDQDHNLPAQACEKRSRNQSPKVKDTHRRARLHWKTLQKVSQNSLWGTLEKETSVTQISFDEDEFNELFKADLAPSLATPKGIGSQRKKGAAVRVIDAKRANNGGIILARVKMTHDEMADAVDRMDSEMLTAEQIENIIEYLPTKEERTQLEKYMLEGGQDAAEKFDGLCECEKFMVSMMTVKHAKRKVRALLFKMQFINCIQSIADDARTIDFACDELKQSSRLKQLLGIVLQFGNRLNTAGAQKKSTVGAFTLDSLLKLNQAKAFDKKTTFLQYVVMIVHRNNELLLNVRDDLPTVLKADKVFWDQVLSDLEEVENQLENVRRISLHEARMRKQYKLQKSANDDDSLGDLELTLEEEVEALRATKTGLFTLSAIKQVSALRDKVESTKFKFETLLEYFGEDNKSMQPHELFNIFCKFSRDFEKAKEESFSKMKKKMRDERKKAQKKGLPPSGAERMKPQSKPLRVSSHQPTMSKVIRDFSQGGNHTQKNPATTTQVQTKRLDSSSSGVAPSAPIPELQSSSTLQNTHPATRRTRADAPSRPLPRLPARPPTTNSQPFVSSAAPNSGRHVPTNGAVAPIASARESAKAALRAKAQQRREHSGQVSEPEPDIVKGRYSRDNVESRGPESDSSPSPPNHQTPTTNRTIPSRHAMRHRRLQAMQKTAHATRAAQGYMQ